MKTLLYLILVLQFYFCAELSQAQQNFNRSYHFGDVTYGMGVIPYHNHYIVGGFHMIAIEDSTLSVGTYYNQVMGFTFRTDLNGDSLFFKDYINVDSAYLNQFDWNGSVSFIHGTRGENGNSYWTGYRPPSDSALYWYQSNLYVVKLDSMGNTIWEKSFDAPGDSSYVGWTIDYNENNGRIVTCGYLTKNTQIKLGLIVEIDTAGTLIRNQTPISANMHFGNFNSIISTDSLIIAGGAKESGGFNNYQPMICCVNNQNQLLWTQYFFPTNNINFVADIIALNNQEFIFYWCHAVKNGTSPWVWVHHLVKMDVLGNILWDKPVFYSYHQNGRLKKLDNGNIMYSGVFKDTLGGPMNGYLVQFDTAGNMLWDRTFTITQGFQWFRDGAPTLDGGFIMTGDITGTIVNPITGDIADDLWIVKTDSNGLITSSNYLTPPSLERAQLSLPYPNPSTAYCTVDVLIPPDAINASLHIFDISGKEIQEIKIATGISQLKIQTENFETGTYLLALSLNGFKGDVVKLIVNK